MDNDILSFINEEVISSGNEYVPFPDFDFSEIFASAVSVPPDSQVSSDPSANAPTIIGIDKGWSSLPIKGANSCYSNRSKIVIDRGTNTGLCDKESTPLQCDKGTTTPFCDRGTNTPFLAIREQPDINNVNKPKPKRRPNRKEGPIRIPKYLQHMTIPDTVYKEIFICNHCLCIYTSLAAARAHQCRKHRKRVRKPNYEKSKIDGVKGESTETNPNKSTEIKIEDPCTDNENDHSDGPWDLSTNIKKEEDESDQNETTISMKLENILRNESIKVMNSQNELLLGDTAGTAINLMIEKKINEGLGNLLNNQTKRVIHTEALVIPCSSQVGVIS